MPFNVQIGISVSGLGASSSEQTALTPEVQVATNPSVGVAKAGTLTTRTNGTDGTLTMASGSHGIITGQRIDLYWAGGFAYGATVGTVSGTSVPFTGFSGTTLPSTSTVCAVATPVKREFGVVGDNLQVLTEYCKVESQVIFVDASVAYLANMHNKANTTYVWYNKDTNPLAGDAVAFVFVSHADLTSSYNISVAAGVSQ